MSQEFENRLTSIEDRLARIESHLNITQPTQIQQNTVNQALIDEWADESPSTSTSTSSPLPKTLLNTKDESPINWLGAAAVICFVLAAAFIIKLSIDSGWLTPARQMGLSALLGFSLIGAGFKLDQMTKHKNYASLLPGGGIVILYLTALATHSYYDLISYQSSLMLISFISAFCIALFIKFKHDAYAFTASVGAYLSPFLLNGESFSDISLSYLLLASLAFAGISIFVQSRLLLLVSANLAILMTAYFGFDLHKDLMVAIFLGLHFVTFSISTYAYSKHHNTPLTETEAWSFMPVLLAFYAMEYYFVDKIAPSLAPWISLSFAAFLMALYLSARKLFQNGGGSQQLILAFTTLACFHSIYIVLIPTSVHPWLLVLIVLGSTLAPTSLLNQKTNTTYFIPFLTVAIIATIEYFSIIAHLFDTDGASWVMVAMAALASLWFAIVTHSTFIKDRTEEGFYALLGAAHLLAILGFYRLTTDIGSLAVSASWLFYAVAVMLFASLRKDEVMAKSALIVLAFSAGKALLYDAANAPTVLRIVCLLLTGAVLYGCGLLMQRISSWHPNKIDKV